MPSSSPPQHTASSHSSPSPRQDGRIKVVILGLGDVGRRIAFGLARHTRATDVIVAGRSRARGEALVRLLQASTAATRFSFAQVDGLDTAALSNLLTTEAPDVVVQSACLLSPWALHERADPLAQALLKAGFALQLSAQLPVIESLMRAVRDSAARCQVVNCSYPDVTNPVLARLDLAPAIGIGNAGMILGLARDAFVANAGTGAGAGKQPLRVLAHHAHVGAVVAADRARLLDAPAPRVFVGEHEVADTAALFAGAPIALDRDLNALSAAHALDVIEALLPGAEALHTAAPGPLGLPGGWPVRIAGGRIELDLPAGADSAAFLDFQHASARADGVQSIDADGTARFTDRLRDALPAAWRHLGDALHPSDALARQRELERALGVAA